MELSELTTAAALLFDNKDYKLAVSDGMNLKNFTQMAVDKIKNTNNIVFGSESTKKKAIEDLTLDHSKGAFGPENITILKDMLVGISAAKEIKMFMAKEKVRVSKDIKIYMTGGVWPKEILKFKVSASGMQDYNSSDIMVTQDEKTFFGISLKKKMRVTEDDPTLINKAFNTLLNGSEFKELNEQLDSARIEFFTNLVIEAVNQGFISYTDINDTAGKKLKTKADWQKFSKSQAGRNELYLSKKKDKTLFDYRYIDTKGSVFHRDGYKTTDTKSDATMRKWVNNQLAKKDCPLWKNFVDIMNNYSDLFADKLIDIILKVNLYESMDAETLKHFDFNFALVTGIGNVTGKGLVNLGKGSTIPLGTTLCGLKRIEKNNKSSKFKIKVDEIKQSSSDLAGVSMVLDKGNLTILNLVLRYKGHYTVQPTFLATIDTQFKDLMKKECTGYR